MKLNVYVLKNTLSNLYASGFELYPNDNYASVTVADLLHEGKKNLNDYQLFRIGTFDNESGRLSSDETHTLINFDTRHIISTPMEPVTESFVNDKISELR